MKLSYDKLLQTHPWSSGRTARYGVSVVSSAVAIFACLLLDRALSGNVPGAVGFTAPLLIPSVATTPWAVAVRPELE